MMNFITYDKVFSLYPFSTFCEKNSIVWGTRTSEERRAAEKYRGRGWRIDHFISLEDMMNRPTELGVKPRRLEDSLCWKFDLEKESLGVMREDKSISAVSWHIGYTTFRIGLTRGNLRLSENAFRGELMFEETSVS